MKPFTKLLYTVALSVTGTLAIASQAFADAPPLPDSGTYFIVNSASEQALQPVQPSAGQNVYLQSFNKGGMQKWTLTRKIDPASKKPTNRYNIRLAGENTTLQLQPHPVADCPAIVSTDQSTLVIESGEAGFLIKSVAQNGDALSILPAPPSDTETRFSPDDGSAKYRWSFVSAN